MGVASFSFRILSEIWFLPEFLRQEFVRCVLRVGGADISQEDLAGSGRPRDLTCSLAKPGIQSWTPSLSLQGFLFLETLRTD